MKKIILGIVALIVVVIVVFAAISVFSWPGSSGNQVDIQFFSFHPSTLTVSAGTTVTWTDMDWFAMHNVIGDGWASPNLSHGGKYSYTFTTPGTYTYRCSHHSWMKGKIIVTP
jgi:plastocyanin